LKPARTPVGGSGARPAERGQYDAYVKGRESTSLLADATGPLPTAEELGAELERFLAEQGKPGDAPGA
jgi:hypothetical protein